MRVRSTYTAPYRKCKYFYLEPRHLKTKAQFVKRIKEVAGNWPTGTFFLKTDSGKIFARFDLHDGKVKQLYKDSPATSMPYPIWQHFK
jgi:hypothetical protein